MKKLIATLFVMTLGFSLVAVAQTYSLKDGLHKNGFSVLEPVQYDASTNTTTYAKIWWRKQKRKKANNYRKSTKIL